MQIIRNKTGANWKLIGKCYDDLGEFLLHETSPHIHWDHIPKYDPYSIYLKDEFAEQIINMRLPEKWVIGSDGRVVQILGVFQKRDKDDILKSVSIDTIYGRSQLKAGVKLEEQGIPARLQDSRLKQFIEFVGLTKNFFTGFALAYPNYYYHLKEDKVKIIEFCLKKKLLRAEFFYFLRLYMVQDEIDGLLADVKMPFKEATETLQDLMKAANEEKNKLEAAKFVIDTTIKLAEIKTKAKGVKLLPTAPTEIPPFPESEVIVN